MADTPTPENTETSQDSSESPVAYALQILEERLEEAVRREEDVDFEGQRTARVTQMISQGALYVSFLLAPVVFYLIFSLILSMGVITDRMEVMKNQVVGMRGNFDQVTERMAAIDQSVGHMTGNVAEMPGMEQHMQQMRGDFAVMTRAMEGIAPDMQVIDQTLARMDVDVAQMNNVFGHLNLNVFSMGRDVNTMSSPMRMLPFFGN
jgi:hypothetical protein